MPHTTYILPYMQHLRPYMAHILQNIHLAYMWMSTYIRNICYFLYVTYMFFPYGFTLLYGEQRIVLPGSASWKRLCYSSVPPDDDDDDGTQSPWGRVWLIIKFHMVTHMGRGLDVWWPPNNKPLPICVRRTPWPLLSIKYSSLPPLESISAKLSIKRKWDQGFTSTTAITATVSLFVFHGRNQLSPDVRRLPYWNDEIHGATRNRNGARRKMKRGGTSTSASNTDASSQSPNESSDQPLVNTGRTSATGWPAKVDLAQSGTCKGDERNKV